MLNYINIKNEKIIYRSLMSFSTKEICVQTNEIVATYKGVTDEGLYKFTDDNINKKFTVTWKTKEIDELDEEGEETGAKTTIKTILTIKEEK